MKKANTSSKEINVLNSELDIQMGYQLDAVKAASKYKEKSIAICNLIRKIYYYSYWFIQRYDINHHVFDDTVTEKVNSISNINGFIDRVVITISGNNYTKKHEKDVSISKTRSDLLDSLAYQGHPISFYIDYLISLADPNYHFLNNGTYNVLDVTNLINHLSYLACKESDEEKVR